MLDFLNLKPTAFGIDISDLSLKIVGLEKAGKKMNLASIGETAMNPGIVKGGEIRNENALIENIKKSIFEVQGKKIKSKYAVASLPEEKAFLQVIQMPILPEADLRSAVVYEAANYIPMPMEEVYLDFQRVFPLQNHLDHQDILIAALPKKMIDSYLFCLKGAGLSPLAFEIESLSIARALIRNEVSFSPVLLIDFGATRTSFIVFSGYSVRFTSSIPVSSRKFTEAIAKNLKTDFQTAENLKIKHGLQAQTEKEGSEVFNALIPALTDLIEQIKKHIDYYQSHAIHEHLFSSGKGLEKILLCGGGANLRGLADFLSRELNLAVEMGNPWANAPLKKSAKEKEFFLQEKSLPFATAIGLALRGMK